MTRKRKHYTPEFKRDAVRLVTEQGYKPSEAARNLGIHPSLLNRWKKELITRGKKAFPDKRHSTSEKEKLQELRKEVKRLKKKRDILKKVAAFFAKEPIQDGFIRRQ